jgi:hypothetical protein
MACSGSHCDAHGTGTTTCSNHRASCSTNRPYSPSGNFTGGTITESDINALRTAIRDEIARYNLHTNHSITDRQTTAYTTSTTIQNEHINDMETMVYDGNNTREQEGVNYAVLNPATTWGTFSKSTYSDGDNVLASHWTTLKSRYDVLRQDCICNSDCSCNLVCACHNDCGCNYSDKRLKKNIKFLYKKNGINLYSFNYTWGTNTHVGVMAQELLETKYKDAVTTDGNGYYMVNYNMLPI